MRCNDMQSRRRVWQSCSSDAACRHHLRLRRRRSLNQSRRSLKQLDLFKPELATSALSLRLLAVMSLLQL